MARTLSPTARQSALEAARCLVLDGGLAAFTVDAVARVSGVAKSTLYRHWSCRGDLLRDTLELLVVALPTPNTGNLRDDLRLCLAPLVTTPSDAGIRRVLLGMLVESPGEPEMERVRIAFMEERERPIRTVIQLAQGRGDVPTDIDPEMLVDTIMGPLISRRILRGLDIDESTVEFHLDIALAGLAAMSNRAGKAHPA